MGSAIWEFTKQYASDTYDETVDFWTRDHPLDDAADAFKFAADNPKLFAQTAKERWSETVNQAEEAVAKDTYKLAIIGGIGLFIYWKYFYKGGK